MTKLRSKLKRFWIERFVAQCTPGASLSPFETFQLGRALRWRYRVVDGLLLQRQHGRITDDELIWLVSSLHVQRQVESQVDEYQERLTALAQAANNGQINRADFVERVVALTTAVLLLAFLLGSIDDVSNLEQAALQLHDTAVELLAMLLDDPDLSADEKERMRQLLDALEDEETVGEALPDQAVDGVLEEINFANQSAVALADDIYQGRYEGDGGDASLAGRIALWVGSALFLFAVGQLFLPGDPFLQWNITPLKDNCATCAPLDGVVRRASAWLALWLATGIAPRSKVEGALECGGWRCGCFFTETEGPNQGEIPDYIAGGVL